MEDENLPAIYFAGRLISRLYIPSYGVGVGAEATPTQEKSRFSLEAPAKIQMGLPWLSVPVWRTTTTHQRMMWAALSCGRNVTGTMNLVSVT